MDPLVFVTGAASLAGLGTAWQMYRRACRAEAEVVCLAEALRAERHAASHDPLTGLLNRRAFYRLGAELVSDPDRPPLAAAVLDVDDFKQVNDRLGHAAGDEVLSTVARRLAAYPGDNLVARLGGDEFAGLLRGTAIDEQWLATTARALTENLAAPMRIAGHRVRMTVSVGLAPVPRGTHLAEALRHADAAMYRVKASGLAPLDSGDLCRHPDIRHAADAAEPGADPAGTSDQRFGPNLSPCWVDRDESVSARQLVDTTPRFEAGGQ